MRMWRDIACECSCSVEMCLGQIMVHMFGPLHRIVRGLMICPALYASQGEFPDAIQEPNYFTSRGEYRVDDQASDVWHLVVANANGACRL